MKELDIDRIIIGCYLNDDYNVAIIFKKSEEYKVRNYVAHIHDKLLLFQMDDFYHFDKRHSQFIFQNKSRIRIIGIGKSLIDFDKLDGVRCDKIVLIQSDEFEEDILSFLKSRIRTSKIHYQHSISENKKALILTKCD